MTHVTCRLTANNRDQLRNPTLGNRVWAAFFTQRVCVQPSIAATNVSLPAFAAERRRLLSIDISCPPGAQQQTRRTGQTDGRTPDRYIDAARDSVNSCLYVAIRLHSKPNHNLRSFKLSQRQKLVFSHQTVKFILFISLYNHRKIFQRATCTTVKNAMSLKKYHDISSCSLRIRHWILIIFGRNVW